MKQRLDKMMVIRGLAATRSEAVNWIQLGRVRVNGQAAVKAGEFVDEASDVTMNAPERYVSRAGLKLASVAHKFAVSMARLCLMSAAVRADLPITHCSMVRDLCTRLMLVRINYTQHYARMHALSYMKKPIFVIFRPRKCLTLS